jgi:hypothetical protein
MPVAGPPATIVVSLVEKAELTVLDEVDFCACTPVGNDREAASNASTIKIFFKSNLLEGVAGCSLAAPNRRLAALVKLSDSSVPHYRATVNTLCETPLTLKFLPHRCFSSWGWSVLLPPRVGVFQSPPAVVHLPHCSPSLQPHGIP